MRSDDRRSPDRDIADQWTSTSSSASSGRRRSSDIKRAYQRLARRYHPDINPGDRMAAAQFRQIAEAYETLSDPERRRQYDAGGHAAAAEAPTFGFEGFDFSGERERRRGADLRRSVRRRAPAARRAAGRRGRRAAPTCIRRSTSGFEDAMRGGQRAADGHAAGALPDVPRARAGCTSAESRCRACQGAGVVKSARGHMVFSRPCAQCGGAGRRARRRVCRACGGRQVEMRTESLTVDLPAGLADGARVRVPGKGHAGRDGGRARRSLRHRPGRSRIPLFRRDGDDLHLVVPVAMHEAALGAQIDVPTLDGPARLRVPPGTQSGQRFRLRERGVAVGAGRPARRSGRRGPARAADAARRALEGAAAGVRPDQRRGRPEGTGGAPMKRTRQGVLHDQRGGAEVQHPPADAAPVRARRAAQAVAHRGQHAPLLRRGPRAARDDPLADARPRRQPRRRRNHPQHAPQDRAHAGRGQRVHGVRQARARARPRRLGAAPVDRARQVVADRSRARDAAARPRSQPRRDTAQRTRRVKRKRSS